MYCGGKCEVEGSAMKIEYFPILILVYLINNMEHISQMFLDDKPFQF